MDTTERELLRDAVGGALDDAASGEADAALTRLGWREMLETETRDAVAVVFEALGRSGATATVLDDVVAVALGHEPREDRAVVLPPFGTWDAARPCGSVIVGCATARIHSATEVLVVHDAGITSASAAVAATTVVRGIDPEAGLHRVEVDVAALEGDTGGAGAWPDALALGRRALAHQTLGASRAMLDLARTHAVDRVQFDRPIARFQAVRHRLADALVAVESLDACLVVAADAPGAETAAVAKAVAGRCAHTVGRHCQQVLAGVGFTTDHPFHRYLKRTMVLDGLLGPADAIVVELGRDLLAARHVPVLVEL